MAKRLEATARDYLRLTLQKSTLSESEKLTQQAVMHLLSADVMANISEAIALFEQAIHSGNANAATFRAGLHLLRLNNDPHYPEAIRLYEIAIKLGNAEAMFYRSRMHYYGHGGEVNYPEAIRLCEKAIKLGNASAMNNRAAMHENGYGGEVNYVEAIRLYELAIELGNADAMFNRARMHNNGYGGEVNYVEAIKLYEQAIELGDAYAMFNRARMHYYGYGGEVNYVEAIKLYEQAIELGDADAMFNRARMHYYGRGGEVNYVEAIRLYDAAYCRSKNDSYERNLISCINTVLTVLPDARGVTVAQDLLRSIWEQLLQGEPFSQQITQFLATVEQSVLERLKSSCDIYQLKQALNSEHPIQQIFKDRTDPCPLNLTLKNRISQLCIERVGFFKALVVNQGLDSQFLPLDSANHVYRFLHGDGYNIRPTLEAFHEKKQERSPHP